MNLVRQLFQHIRLLFGKFLSSGRLWGLLRLVLVLVILLLFANWGRFVWSEPGSEPASLIWWWGLRYWVMPMVALVGAFLTGTLYHKRLHALRRQRIAWHYLVASAFSLSAPILVVKDGQPSIPFGQENSVSIVGGPGRLNIRPGSAVVVETLFKPTRVLGAGLHYLTRLERLREIISLADQHSVTEQVVATTKDGIEVNAKQISFRYRLQTGRQPRDYRKRTMEDPYPFSPQAARKLAYQRTAFSDGSITPWERVVKNAVDGVVTDYLNANQFDPVTTPLIHQQDPRATMFSNMNAKDLRGRLRGTGTELLWFDIGLFEPKFPDVDIQRIESWGTKWSGIAELEMARSEGHRRAKDEIARARAYADLLTATLESLRSSGVSEKSVKNRQDIRRLFVVRTAQLLERMVEPSIGKVQEPPPSITIRRFKVED